MSKTQTFEVYQAIKSEHGRQLPVEDSLVVEEMLSIAVNGKPYTITMRTPGFEEEHTRGILLTEDVYVNPDKNPSFIVTGRNEKGMSSHQCVGGLEISRCKVLQSLLGKLWFRTKNNLSRPFPSLF